MHSEISAAVAFLCSHVPEGTEVFSNSLRARLFDRLCGHWYPTDSERGSAYRCLTFGPASYVADEKSIVASRTRLDPLVASAALESGLDLAETENGLFLGSHWTLWIDPGCVCYRVTSGTTLSVVFGVSKENSGVRVHAAEEELSASAPRVAFSPGPNALRIVRPAATVAAAVPETPARESDLGRSEDVFGAVVHTPKEGERELPHVSLALSVATPRFAPAGTAVHSPTPARCGVVVSDTLQRPASSVSVLSTTESSSSAYASSETDFDGAARFSPDMSDDVAVFSSLCDKEVKDSAPADTMGGFKIPLLPSWIQNPLKNVTSQPPATPGRRRRNRNSHSRNSSVSSSGHSRNSSVISLPEAKPLTEAELKAKEAEKERRRKEALAGRLVEHSGGKVGVLGGGVLLGVTKKGSAPAPSKDHIKDHTQNQNNRRSRRGPPRHQHSHSTSFYTPFVAPPTNPPLMGMNTVTSHGGYAMMG